MSAFIIFLTVVLTIVGMVFLYMKIIPKKFDGSFNNRLFQELHNFFSFKKLYLEEILKFMFILLTVGCIASGIAAILGAFFGIFQNIGNVIDYGMPFENVISAFLQGVVVGLLTAVLGVVIVRIIYEGVMMFIILVKNVIELNNKTKSPGTKTE